MAKRLTDVTSDKNKNKDEWYEWTQSFVSDLAAIIIPESVVVVKKQFRAKEKKDKKISFTENITSIAADFDKFAADVKTDLTKTHIQTIKTNL
jgi:hypothetical protein